MGAQDSSSGDQSQQYLSKRVMINGQFVTLYSVNGVTWLSSPEDIPDTMARLDNTRVTLSDEKAPDGEKDEKGGKGDKGEKAEKAAAPAPKPQGSQYRMKGPKPRPILRQGGKVVEGTPIEPISASSVNIKGAADVALPQVKLSPMEQGIRRGKIVAPIAQRRPGKPKVTPPPTKKVAPSVHKVVAPVGKVAAPTKGKMPPVPAKAVATTKVAKGGKSSPKVAEKAKKVAPPVKAASKKAAQPAPKKVAKPAKVAKKAVAKKPAPKKASSKSAPKKRTR
jgi:hypothetical protein